MYQIVAQYKNKVGSDFPSELKIKGFNAFQISSNSQERIRIYHRRGYCKISLYRGKHLIHYAGRSYETNAAVLFFGNPNIASSSEIITSTDASYTCTFCEGFFNVVECSDCLKQSPLFTFCDTPFLKLNPQQETFVAEIFEKMIEEQMSCYSYKEELILNYIHLLLHEALKTASSIKMKESSEEVTTSI